MKTLEEGQKKIKQICDQLRKETIEPAQRDADTIIQEAQKKRDAIIAEGEKEAKRLISHAHSTIEQDRNVFNSSLEQAGKQAVEALRQEIESHLFNAELQKLIDKQLSDPQVIANLINALIKDIEKKGIDANLEVLIPQHVSSQSINALLLDEVRKRLKEKPLVLDHFAGGVQVKLIDKKMTVDLTDKTVKDLLSKYIRKDFRQMLYNA